MVRQKFLITGTSSGLGQYLLEEFQGTPFRRTELNEIDCHKNSYYDCIVHCAADTRNIIQPDELWTYYKSNIELTRKLTEVPHGLFVYISSPAVYPDPFQENSETDVPNFPEINQSVHHTYYLYGLFKLLAEQVVSKNTQNYLILRCVCLIGRTSRLTNIIKILRSNPAPLTLSADSSFNLLAMSQIKGFIELALSQNINGIFNAGSTKNATLGEIAQAIGCQPKFGNFTHNVHRMDTKKIRKVSLDFNKDSLTIAQEAAKKFKEDYKWIL